MEKRACFSVWEIHSGEVWEVLFTNEIASFSMTPSHNITHRMHRTIISHKHQ
jgi:hypothetical protein